MTAINSMQLSVLRSENLFRPNDCLNLRPTENDGYQLAGLSFTLRPDLSVRQEAIWSCIAYATQAVRNEFPTVQMWICACHGGYNNRLTWHRRLWKGLEACGVRLSPSTTAGEVEVESADAVYFYGATVISSTDLQQAAEILRPASRSFLVAMSPGIVPDIAALVDAGWKRGFSDLDELRDLTTVIAKQGGIVFRPFGEFDDPEAGIDCLMNTAMYSAFISNFNADV